MSVNRFSKVFTPSEYVAPFDLNTYGRIGAQKDAEFERNLQLLQSGLDTIASTTKLARPADQEYFYNKLAGVVNKMNQHGNEDLGDPAVLSNMQGLSRSIYGDQGLIAAIGATQVYQKDQQRMAEDEKKGNLPIYAKYHVDKAVSAWMDPKDKTVGKPYQSSYIQAYKGSDALFKYLQGVKATGQIEMRDMNGNPITDASGQLQYQQVHTKDLTSDRMKVIASEWINTHPDMIQDLNLQQEYLADNMRPEDMTKQYQDFSFQKAAELTTQLNQLTAQKQEALRVEPTQKGKDDITAYYDDQIRNVSGEQKRYSELKESAKTAVLQEAITKEPYKYYNEIFMNNYLNGVGNAFRQHDETAVTVTNLAEALRLKHNYALQLLNAKAASKSKDGIQLSYVDKADETDNTVNYHDQLFEKRDEINKTNESLDKNIRQDLNENTAGYGGSFPDNPGGNKAYEENMKKWRDLYKIDPQNKSIPTNVKSYFASKDILKGKELLNNQIITAGEEVLSKDPAVVLWNSQVGTSLNKLPAKYTVIGENGKPGDTYSREDYIPLSNAITSKDYYLEDINLVDKNGDIFGKDGKTGLEALGFKMPGIKVMLFKGNSEAIKKLNARQKLNIQNAIKDAKNYNLAGNNLAILGGQTFVLDYLRSKGVMVAPPDNWYAGIEEGLAFLPHAWRYAITFGEPYTDLGGVNRTGNVFDFVYGNQDNANHKALDLPSTTSGFYHTIDKGQSTIKDAEKRAFSGLGTAHMQSVLILDNKPELKGLYKNAVISMRSRYSLDGDEAPVVDVTSVTTDAITGYGKIEYTSGTGDKNKLHTLPIPAEQMRGLSQMIPTNPMAEYEQYLKNESILKQQKGNNAGISNTPIDINEAIVLPDTNIKVYFKYNPLSPEAYTYAVWTGHTWGREHSVPTLEMARLAILQQRGNPQADGSTNTQSQ